MPDLTHHTLAGVHAADAGRGSTVLLVHGFPETWWAFHALLPHLTEHHRVLAVDLPGFGESDIAGLDSEQSAAGLADVIDRLGAGPVHLVGQDVSGAPTYRLAATRPDLVASWTAVETVLPGFGFEALADVAHGGAWYIGVLAAPDVPELLLPGRERAVLGAHVLAPQVRVPVRDDDVEELTRTYARPGGFRGAAALYRSLLTEGPSIRALAATPLTMPVLTVSGSAGDAVPGSVRNVAPDLEHVALAGVGHYVALEAPEALADALLPFFASVDHTRTGTSCA